MELRSYRRCCYKTVFLFTFLYFSFFGSHGAWKTNRMKPCLQTQPPGPHTVVQTWKASTDMITMELQYWVPISTGCFTSVEASIPDFVRSRTLIHRRTSIGGYADVVGVSGTRIYFSNHKHGCDLSPVESLSASAASGAALSSAHLRKPHLIWFIHDCLLTAFRLVHVFSHPLKH